MRSKREKTIAILLFAILTMSFMGAFVAADLPLITIPSTKNTNSISLWTTSIAHSGTYSLHMDTGTVGPGDEARLTIMIFGGISLGDITTLSWWEYLVAGYPPHVDVILDVNGDGTQDESLNFEYAYNTLAHYAENGGLMPYGAVTGGWYQTFNDDGNGPSQIDDTTSAWVNSGPPGPPGAIQLHTLATWKSGIVLTTGSMSGLTVDANTVVLGFEIEIDNWVVNSEAYLDDVELNGVNLLDYTGPTGPQGIQGIQGVPGVDGADGADGATGPQGIQGDTGPQGIRGVRGYTGSTGPEGPEGPQGEIGIGIVGPEGPEGTQGSQGLQGVAGEAGESIQGETGSMGPQGETGEQGSQGEIGEQGPKGSTGPQGVSGPTTLIYTGVAMGVVSLLGLLYQFTKPK